MPEPSSTSNPRAAASAKLRTAEQMLEDYIKQRKKPLAELALATLLELAPEHPRRHDYALWVAEIDREVAEQSRVETAADRVRSALALRDVAAARDHLKALRLLDADAAEALAGALEQTAQAVAQDASIDARKQRIESLLVAGEVNDAEAEIEALAEHNVPKVSLDFLRRRLADRRAVLRQQAELRSLESVFERQLERRHWQSASDVARVVGDQLGDLERASHMLAEIDRQEAAERRSRSVQQGLAALEGFLEAGDCQQAEVALRVLRGLSVDESALASYRRRLEAM